MTNRYRWQQRAMTVAVVATALILGGCSQPQPLTMQELGLDVTAQLQPGSTFSMTVPLPPDTTMQIVSQPASVVVTDIPTAIGLAITIAVDPDAAFGAQNLGLVVNRDGVEQEVNWIFDIVPPAEIDGAPMAFESPEELRLAVAEAIAGSDALTLQKMWPADNWDDLGISVLETFDPVLDDGGCTTIDEVTASCHIFQKDLPFAIGLTVKSGDSRWTVVSASLDSTN